MRMVWKRSPLRSRLEGISALQASLGPARSTRRWISPTASSILAGSDFAFLHQLELLLDTGLLLFAPRYKWVGADMAAPAFLPSKKKRRAQCISSSERPGREIVNRARVQAPGRNPESRMPIERTALLEKLGGELSLPW